jgi:hypothetical protein
MANLAAQGDSRMFFWQIGETVPVFQQGKTNFNFYLCELPKYMYDGPSSMIGIRIKCSVGSRSFWSDSDP